MKHDIGSTHDTVRGFGPLREKVRRFYEQTRNGSKAKQTRRVSDYRKRWLRWAYGLGIIIAAYSQQTMCAGYTVPQGAGFVSGSISINATRNEGGNGNCSIGPPSNADNLTPLMLGSVSATGPGVQSGTSYYQWGYSSDGKAYGLIIATDVILVHQGTYTTVHNIQGTGLQTKGTLNFSQSGISLTNTTGLGVPLYTQYNRFTWSGGNVGIAATVTTYMTSYRYPLTWNPNFKATYYIGPNAVAGTYTITNYNTACNAFLPMSVVPYSVTVTAMPVIICDMPGTYNVPFGTKDKNALGGATNLGQAQSDVSLTCSSDTSGYSVEGKAKFNVTGTSNTYQGNNKWLSMKDSTPADTGVVVAGVWGTSGESPCDAPDSSLIAFDGTAPHTITLGEGSKTFPITWGLCNKGTGWPSGEVKASATLTIDWD